MLSKALRACNPLEGSASSYLSSSGRDTFSFGARGWLIPTIADNEFWNQGCTDSNSDYLRA